MTNENIETIVREKPEESLVGTKVLVPTCGVCRKIRIDDEETAAKLGAWINVTPEFEKVFLPYLSGRGHAPKDEITNSHTLCPICLDGFRGELRAYKKSESRNNNY